MTRHPRRWTNRKAKPAGSHLSPEYTAVGPPIGEFNKREPDRHGQDLLARGIRYEDYKPKPKGETMGLRLNIQRHQRPKRLRKAKAKARKKPLICLPAGVCRDCGCTDRDCRQCIAITGMPCRWADPERTLCTRCA